MNRLYKSPEIIDIVVKLIRVDARSEALEILDKCSDVRYNEFINYWNNKQDNICCLVLDLGKKELVELNQMIHNKEDYFGSPWLEITQKEF